VSRLTITAAVAWLLAIFLVWFMIRIDNAGPSWLQIGTSSRPVPVRPEHDTVKAPESVTMSCEDTENRLRDRVQTARYCTTDSECTLFDYGYPIDCMTSVAKAEITDLRLEYRKYELSCEYRVYFDCPAEPMLRRAVCRENRCGVALVATDTLEEQTLEYLGIGGPGQ
jgi:hypothetical protein